MLLIYLHSEGVFSSHKHRNTAPFAAHKGYFEGYMPYVPSRSLPSAKRLCASSSFPPAFVGLCARPRAVIPLFATGYASATGPEDRTGGPRAPDGGGLTAARFLLNVVAPG